MALEAIHFSELAKDLKDGAIGVIHAIEEKGLTLPPQQHVGITILSLANMAMDAAGMPTSEMHIANFLLGLGFNILMHHHQQAGPLTAPSVSVDDQAVETVETVNLQPDPPKPLVLPQ